jgi:TATA-box binding protein (TBP) (component of TFIID and TFIIIB)
MALNLEEVSNLDDEWNKFLTNMNKDSDNEYESYNDNENNNDNEYESKYDIINQNSNNYKNEMNTFIAPEASELYISTISKIAFLNIPIDLNIFWDIPIIPYSQASNGVIKKQMKFVSLSQEELDIIQENLKKELYYEEYIISHIDNQNSRIKYKDVRKVSIGISKKDIMSCRTKKKQAFYNCFVMILRIFMNDLYKEFHVKIFNTGKIEIPGIQNNEMYDIVLDNVINILQSYIKEKLYYKTTTDTVLINSNFNCGFQINREVLFEILKYKYNIRAIYDPCSYPGIQSKFYYKKNSDIQNGCKEEDMTDVIEVSFMIFRTGSVLIVGMCEEYVLSHIYNFLKKVFKTEFNKICHKLLDKKNYQQKDKKRKIRKRVITIS